MDSSCFLNGTSAALDSLWKEHGIRGIRNSIAVSWPAGDRRIGSLAAYDSERGFTNDDAWILRVAAMATGLVWQYREAEEELDVAVERLEEAMAARRQLLANVASGANGGSPTELTSLTQREHEVLALLSKGHSHKFMAARLRLSAYTVHGHVRNIFEKLGVHNRVEAVVKYFQK